MQKRSSFVAGTILIVVGVLLLALQFVPETVRDWLDFSQRWPLILVGIGLLLLLSALARTPPLAVGGSVLIGLGLLMYYQNLTNNWDSWAYAWALIPGFVGVGTVVKGALERKFNEGLREGGRLMATSATLFVVFGAFLGGWADADLLWPALLILLGIWLLFRNLVRARQ